MQGVINNNKTNLLSFHIDKNIDFPLGNNIQTLLNGYIKYPIYFLVKHLKKIGKQKRIILRIFKKNKQSNSQ